MLLETNIFHIHAQTMSLSSDVILFNTAAQRDVLEPIARMNPLRSIVTGRAALEPHPRSAAVNTGYEVKPFLTQHVRIACHGCRDIDRTAPRLRSERMFDEKATGFRNTCMCHQHALWSFFSLPRSASQLKWCIT
eukprot:scpid107333/ scgid24572/ 